MIILSTVFAIVPFFKYAAAQITICADIPKIKKAPWFDELKSKNISLTDFESSMSNTNEPIDVLIGADVAGKLFTGKKHDLPSDLSAFETRLGWVIMGKNPSSDRKNCTFNELSMFVSEAKIEDLWKLDTLGIKDPIEKTDQITNEQRVKDNFSPHGA